VQALCESKLQKLFPKLLTTTVGGARTSIVPAPSGLSPLVSGALLLGLAGVGSFVAKEPHLCRALFQKRPDNVTGAVLLGLAAGAVLIVCKRSLFV